MPVKKKKTTKMEKRLVSKEPHELKYVAKKTKKPLKAVKAAQKKTRSRKKITEALTKTTSSATSKTINHDAGESKFK